MTVGPWVKKALQATAVALALTTISLAALIEPLVESAHIPIYHWSGNPSVLFGPIALDVVLLWGALTLLLISAERPGRWRIAVWTGILLFLPWLTLRNVHRLAKYAIPHWFLLVLAVWAVVVLLWRPSRTKQADAVIKLASTVLAFVVLTSIFFLTQFGWFWWRADGANRRLPLHPMAPIVHVAAVHPNARVIWIILDELSYQQVYEQRYPGLKLPAFDALAQDSTVFTNVIPAGSYTEKVIPALLTGVATSDLHSSADGRPLFYNESTSHWKQLDAHNTVFEDALNDGYETALAGWYNPYCRMLSSVLTRCYWSDDETLENGLAAHGTFRSNLLASTNSTGWVHSLLSKVLDVSSSEQQQQTEPELHVLDYRNLYAAGDKLLLDRREGFVFLHLPIPHPPGIYNRATGQMTVTPSTYMDNLALADKYVAHVRDVLEKSGQWDSSNVIFMGDHGWRTSFLWKFQAEWTKDEEKASDGGKFDSRPGYIVKLAGEKTGTRIDVPFDAIRTRALMDSLMNGSIRSTDDLNAWVNDRKPSSMNRATSRSHSGDETPSENEQAVVAVR